MCRTTNASISYDLKHKSTKQKLRSFNKVRKALMWSTCSGWQQVLSMHIVWFCSQHQYHHLYSFEFTAYIAVACSCVWVVYYLQQTGCHSASK